MILWGTSTTFYENILHYNGLFECNEMHILNDNLFPWGRLMRKDNRFEYQLKENIVHIVLSSMYFINKNLSKS